MARTSTGVTIAAPGAPLASREPRGSLAKALVPEHGVVNNAAFAGDGRRFIAVAPPQDSPPVRRRPGVGRPGGPVPGRGLPGRAGAVRVAAGGRGPAGGAA